ncbi:hypothetical protein ACLOJK_020512, partial [Asimina triloba]
FRALPEHRNSVLHHLPQKPISTRSGDGENGAGDGGPDPSRGRLRAAGRGSGQQCLLPPQIRRRREDGGAGRTKTDDEGQPWLPRKPFPTTATQRLWRWRRDPSSTARQRQRPTVADGVGDGPSMGSSDGNPDSTASCRGSAS